MVILNEADAIFLGDRPASAVYLGEEKVWPPEDHYIAAVLADNPVGFWPLDDETGTTARDLTGNNPGTYVNPSWLNLGAEGPSAGFVRRRAITLDNQYSPQPGYVEIPYSPAFDSDQAFTLEIWLYRGLGTPGALIGRTNDVARARPWHIDMENGLRIILVGIPETIDAEWRATPLLAVGDWVGAWTYLVLTHENDVSTVYRNGGVLATSPQPTGSFLEPVPIFLGQRRLHTNPFWGRLALAAVYDYALTSQQVTGHYAASGVT
jgi:hypothetical protein